MFGSLHNDFIKSLIWTQEYSTDASANRQRKNTESVICSRPAKRVLFYTSRCSPVFSSFHQKKIKCCWNPGPFQKSLPLLPADLVLLARPMRFTTGWLSLILLFIFHQGWGERWWGRRDRTEGMKEMERENNESKRRRWEVYRCMLGGTKHINEMFLRSNDWNCLQPGECVKDFEFLCLGLIGFNVYIGFFIQ